MKNSKRPNPSLQKINESILGSVFNLINTAATGYGRYQQNKRYQELMAAKTDYYKNRGRPTSRSVPPPFPPPPPLAPKPKPIISNLSKNLRGIGYSPLQIKLLKGQMAGGAFTGKTDDEVFDILKGRQEKERVEAEERKRVEAEERKRNRRPKPSTPVTGDDASNLLGKQPSAPVGGIGVTVKPRAGSLTNRSLPKPSSFTAGINFSKYGINPYKQESSTYYGDIAKLIRESFQLNEGEKKNLRIIAAAERNPTNPSLQSAAEDARARINKRKSKIADKMTWQTTDDELRRDAAKRTSDNKTKRGRNRAEQRLAGLRLQRNVPTGQRVPRHRS